MDSKDGAGDRRAEGGEPLADKDVDMRFKRAVRNLLAAPKKPPAKPKPRGRQPVVTERKKPGG